MGLLLLRNNINVQISCIQNETELKCIVPTVQLHRHLRYLLVQCGVQVGGAAQGPPGRPQHQLGPQRGSQESEVLRLGAAVQLVREVLVVGGDLLLSGGVDLVAAAELRGGFGCAPDVQKNTEMLVSQKRYFASESAC